MAQSSTLSRHRLAVLAATGAATAYLAYTLYQLHGYGSNESALHRSNAVHRSRRRQASSAETRSSTGQDSEDVIEEIGRQIGFEIEESPEHVLGLMHVTNASGEVLSTTRLGLESLPSAAALEEMCGANLRTYAEVVALESIISIMSRTEQESDIFYELEDMAPSRMVRTVWTRGDDLLVSILHDLPGLNDINRDVIIGCINQYIATQLAQGTARDLEGNPVQRAAFMTATVVNPERYSGYAPERLDGAHQRPSVHWGDTTEADHEDGEPSQGIKGLLYFIAEEDATRKAYEHRGVSCESCGEQPIRGIRWRCMQCPKFDFCSTCESTVSHNKTHVFAKIKIPVPTLMRPSHGTESWYPAEHMGQSMEWEDVQSAEAYQGLSREYGYAQHQLDALHEQFVCLANVPLAHDTSKRGIDRISFRKAMSSEKWEPLEPNILYDRMFAFYDWDMDGLISFEEFVRGLAYLRGSNRFEPLDLAVAGFDCDNDGYVDRKDFLRLLLAKYEIQKLLMTELVRSNHTEQAMGLIRSSQPVSAAFTEPDIPRGQIRIPGGKQQDAFGDMVPAPGVSAVLPSNAPWSATRQMSPRQLQERLSRFEEMLYGSDDGEQMQPSSSRNRHQMQPSSSGNRYQMQSSSSRNRHRHVQAQPLEPNDETLDFSILDLPDQTAQTGDIPIEDADLLHTLVVEGFTELLHPLFSTKETLARRVRETRHERAAHRTEIDAFVAERKRFEEHMCEQAAVDPLMATALRSYQATGAIQEDDRPGFQPQMLPTDEATLAQAEREIAEKGLEELLRDTGYSMAVDEETAPHVTMEERSRSVEGDCAEVPGVQDPTMPQNMPASEFEAPTAEETPTVQQTNTVKFADSHDTPQATPQPEPSTSGEKRTLTNAELAKLAGYDQEEKEIKARGGPGRLSYREVEAIAKDDSSGQLRGLIVGWLDWASF